MLPEWDSYAEVLSRAHRLAIDHLDSVPDAAVGAPPDLEELRAALGGELSESGEDGVSVLEHLARAAEPGIVTSNGPRYFGFVIGGGVPAAVGADWMTSAWDQVAGLNVCSPAAAVAEEVAAGWLLELLGLPETAVVGFATGAQMANFTGLAAARGAELRRVGWDVEASGLQGAPKLNVVVGDQAHVTVFAALRFLGLGAETAVRVSADEQGRMISSALAEALSGLEGPTVVCAQAGEVNTGAFDPFDEIADLCERHGAWLHVDGAFGLWAAAAPALREQVRGVERADSWATDAHKWLNVPYDSGLAIVRDRDAVRSAMQLSAAYLVAGEEARDGTEYVPEASRRARGFVDLVRSAIPRARRSRRDDRTLLGAGAAHGGRALLGEGRAAAQRGRAQPGAVRDRRRRRHAHRRNDRPGAGGWDLLARGDQMARHSGDPCLHQQLVDDRARRDSVRRGHPGRYFLGTELGRCIRLS